MRPVQSVRLLTLIAAGLASAPLLKAQAPFAEQAGSPAASYGQLPLHFESNQGQVDSQVRFLARGSGYSLFLTPTEAVLALKERGTAGPAVMRMKLAGANPSPHVTGHDELSGKTNYFVGADPAGWRTNIQNYARVQYRGVYPGIDLVYYGNQGQLEYDFVVAPGADPGRITMSFDGARDIRIDPSGDLILHVAGGDLRQHKPVVYQEAQGVRQKVAGRYVMKGKRHVGFELGTYDGRRPLVIDPVLVYSTFLGGNANDSGNDVAVDAAGNAYVTGEATSTGFPTTPGAFRTFSRGSGDAFVTKLDASGSTLVYSTYLGGTGTDSGNGIAVDAAGNAYVTGSTLSANFPVTPGAFDTVSNRQDAFVAKLNDTGSALLYSTFLGGGGSDVGNDITVDSSFHTYVTGQTFASIDPTPFPTTPGAFDSARDGSNDAFVTKLNPAGSGVVYSTYLGGDGTESGNSIVVDTAGRAFVTGQTSSPGLTTHFPTTPGAFDSTRDGSDDAFVTKFDATGSSLMYSTYLGGGSTENGNGIAVDVEGNAYVTGQTSSSDFPTTSGAFQGAYGGAGDAFITTVNASGGALLSSTYLGGIAADHATGIAVNTAGSAYVTGETRSSDFPVTPAAIDTTLGGIGDAFVTKLSPAGSALIDSTYVGGSAADSGNGIAVDRAGNAYVTGSTHSMDFPVTPGSLDMSFNAGSEDAFVAKIGLVPASLTLDPSEDTNPVNSEHCVTAAVDDAAGNPVPGVTVRFTVMGAVNTSGSGTTNDDGQAEFCYTGPVTPGIDAISAFADADMNGTQDASEPDGRAAKTWVPHPPATLTLTPAEETNPIGARHCVIASVADASGNPVSGVTVRFAIAGAVNTGGTATTDPNGEAVFCYDGPLMPGADSITAYADTNNDGGSDAGEPWGAASKTWVVPPPPPTCGEVEGKGLITTTGGVAGFWFEVEQGRLGTPPEGHLVYAQRGRLFRSTQITLLSIMGNKATIHGRGRENNGPVVPFQVDVTDGRPDTFKILWSGYAPEGRVWGDVEIAHGCDSDDDHSDCDDEHHYH
jgi:beta-propeller repeat-containing protein